MVTKGAEPPGRLLRPPRRPVELRLLREGILHARNLRRYGRTVCEGRLGALAETVL